MVDVELIFAIIQNAILSVALLLTIVYSILILSIRRFRNQNNAFIVNICFAVIAACIFFVTYFTLNYFNPPVLFNMNTCFILFYAYNFVSLGIPFAFMTFSIHRFFFIVYNTKPFFKSKKWVTICITSQWSNVVLLSLPIVFYKVPVSKR